MAKKNDVLVSKEFGVADQHANRKNIDTILPKLLMDKFCIASFADIGCGLGGQVEEVRKLGIHAIGIDGDPRARTDDGFIKHDYTKGPLVIEHTDLGWSSAFIEHMEEMYLPNFMRTFQCCKYVCTTYAPPGLGGRHHVNCKPQEYWVKKFEEFGFIFNPKLSEELRSVSDHKWMKLYALFFFNMRIHK